MVELRGVTELYYDRRRAKILCRSCRSLRREPGPSHLRKSTSFALTTVDKPHESYNGNNVRVRYYVIVTASKSKL